MGMPVDVFSGPFGSVKEHWAMQVGKGGQIASGFAKQQGFLLGSSQMEDAVGDGPQAECPGSTVASKSFRVEATTEQAHVGQGMEPLRSNQEQVARGL